MSIIEVGSIILVIGTVAGIFIAFDHKEKKKQKELISGFLQKLEEFYEGFKKEHPFKDLAKVTSSSEMEAAVKMHIQADIQPEFKKFIIYLTRFPDKEPGYFLGEMDCTEFLLRAFPKIKSLCQHYLRFRTYGASIKQANDAFVHDLYIIIVDEIIKLK